MLILKIDWSWLFFLPDVCEGILHDLKVGEMNPTAEVAYLHHMLGIPWRRKLLHSHVVSQLQHRSPLSATIYTVSIALI